MPDLGVFGLDSGSVRHGGNMRAAALFDGRQRCVHLAFRGEEFSRQLPGTIPPHVGGQCRPRPPIHFGFLGHLAEDLINHLQLRQHRRTELLLLDQLSSLPEGVIEAQSDLVRRHVVLLQPSYLSRCSRRDHDHRLDQYATTR